MYNNIDGENLLIILNYNNFKLRQLYKEELLEIFKNF